MTLDEAIKHAEEVAEKNEKKASWFWGKEGNPNYQNCVECAKEHRQLAEWLKELKQLREINEKLIKEYISKVECCDECFASIYCIVNGLRKSRVPQDYCVENIKRYFRDKVSPIGRKARIRNESAISY